jgi:hypothetical protein
MARVGKGFYASSLSTDLRGLTGRGCASLCLRMLEKLQVINVPARNSISYRRSSPAYVVRQSKNMERGNPVPLPCAMQSRHYRKACCWSGGIERLKKAKAIRKADG